MNLLERLRSFEGKRPALISQSGALTYATLVSEAASLAPKLGQQRLFLNIKDVAETVVLLAAADGIAASIVLASPHFESAILNELFSLSQSDNLISNINQIKELDRPGVENETGLVTDWIMTTSGTTGRPKLVSHKLDGLTRTTRTDHIGVKEQVWGLLYDHTRFAGLQVVLQSLLSGSLLVVPPTDLPLVERLAYLAHRGCTHLSATPTLWRKILMTDGHEQMPLRQITLGGEIADDHVLSALSRSWPDARISHIFASTEAGVGFSVSDRRAGFPASFLEHAPSGVDLKIVDGRLHIRNDLVGDRYLGNQEALSCEGWVNTGDLVEIDGDRVLFRGRDSGVINVGGDKVHPEEVERTILSHPKVQLVRVYAKPNPITGALVAADIVPTPDAGDAKLLRAEIKAYLDQRLDRHMVPAFMRIVADFDINSAGKLKRNSNHAE